MSQSIERVQQVLDQHQITSEILQLEQSTHTAQQAASALNCNVSQIVKSLIFKTTDSEQAILALVGGDKRLDEDKLAQLLDENIGKADASFVKTTTGFTIGGVAPVGSLTAMQVFLDQDLLKHDLVWAAAGHPKSIFSIAPNQLVGLTGAVTADLAQSS